MTRAALYSFILLIIFSTACTSRDKIFIQSPDGLLSVKFEIQQRKAYYSVLKNNKLSVKTSMLGFRFNNLPNLDGNFVIQKTEEKKLDETWEQSWGEKRYVRNNYRYIGIYFQERNNLKRKLDIIFRVFNDGVGVKNNYPKQENIDSVQIVDEETEFNRT